MSNGLELHPDINDCLISGQVSRALCGAIKELTEAVRALYHDPAGVAELERRVAELEAENAELRAHGGDVLTAEPGEWMIEGHTARRVGGPKPK
jgi:hypothetical protein